MNSATLIFGYLVRVQAPAASFASLNKAWTKSLQEHDAPYFFEEKHAIVCVAPMVALEDGRFDFQAVFGVEVDWHDWPALTGFTVGRTSATGIRNVGYDTDALPTGRKLLERSLKKAQKLKKKTPLQPVELAFESKQPSAYLVGPGVAPIRLLFGCIVEAPPASLPERVTTHTLGASALVGFELATLAAGERVVEVAIDPGEGTLQGKEEDQLVAELSAVLGKQATADTCGIFLVSPSLPAQSLRLDPRLTKGATVAPPPDFTFVPEETATAYLFAGRRFDHARLSTDGGARLEGLLEQASAASGLKLWWQVTGDASALREQLESSGDRGTEAASLVVGCALAVADCDAPSAGLSVGEVRAALRRLGDQVPDTFWTEVAHLVTPTKPGRPSAASQPSAASRPSAASQPSAVDELLLLASGPLASAYLAAGELVDAGTAQKTRPALERLVGKTMEQRPQRTGVLGTRLATIDHDDSLTQLASVTTPILDLPDDASLHLIASYD